MSFRYLEFPVRIGGYVGLYWTELQSLMGGPLYVKNDVVANNIQITSLEGAPLALWGHFTIDGNNITSLKGGPVYVNGYYSCMNTTLTSLEGAPAYIGGDFIINEDTPVFPRGVSQDIVREMLKDQGCTVNGKIKFLDW